MIIVYSGARVRGVKGRSDVRCINPVWFTGPEAGASIVYLNGDYPAIRAAYERIGVVVSRLDNGRLRTPLPAPPASIRRARRKRSRS